MTDDNESSGVCIADQDDEILAGFIVIRPGETFRIEPAIRKLFGIPSPRVLHSKCTQNQHYDHWEQFCVCNNGKDVSSDCRCEVWARYSEYYNQCLCKNGNSEKSECRCSVGQKWIGSSCQCENGMTVESHCLCPTGTTYDKHAQKCECPEGKILIDDECLCKNGNTLESGCYCE